MILQKRREKVFACHCTHVITAHRISWKVVIAFVRVVDYRIDGIEDDGSCSASRGIGPKHAVSVQEENQCVQRVGLE